MYFLLFITFFIGSFLFNGACQTLVPRKPTLCSSNCNSTEIFVPVSTYHDLTIDRCHYAQLRLGHPPGTCFPLLQHGGKQRPRGRRRFSLHPGGTISRAARLVRFGQIHASESHRRAGWRNFRLDPCPWSEPG